MAKKNKGAAEKSGPVEIVLPEALDVEGATEAAGRIKTALADNGRVSLDASRVERIAAPGVQMLLSAYKYEKSHNGTICLAGISDAAMRAAEILGADKELHQWKEKVA